MARNRTVKTVIVATQNTWVNVPVTVTGKSFTVKTARLTPATAVVEVALSVASPAGAGTVILKEEATGCMIMNAATHTLWVRRTDASAVPITVEIDPRINGNVLSATA